MWNSVADKIKEVALPMFVGRKNPIAGGIVYWFQKTSKIWVILSLIIIGAFIVLVNAAIEWSNHNPKVAIIVASSIILLILLSVFVMKNKRISIFLFFLFASIYITYLYYTAPEAEVFVEEAIEEGVSTYNEVKKAVQDSP